MRPSLLVYLVALAACLATIFTLGSELPPRVATHFDITGKADGWMARDSCVHFFALFAVGFSLFLPALLAFIRFVLPNIALNVPAKAYWSQPENRRTTHDHLLFSSFWLSTLEVLFVASLFLLTVDANRSHPPALNNVGIWSIAAIFIGGTIFWLIHLYSYFRKPLSAGKSS